MIIFAIIIGLIIPVQTAVNTKLSVSLKSSLLGSAISFIVGTIFLGLIILFSKSYLTLTTLQISKYPLWIWTGGIFGVIGLTTNILLFPKIGSIQTVLMPLIGQILMSAMIDSFGWFGAIIHQFNMNKLLGIIFAFGGTILIIFKKGENSQRQNLKKNAYQLKWQLLGVFAGACIAIQSVVNAKLGSLLSSTVVPAFFSFLSGSLLLSIILIVQKKFYISEQANNSRTNHPPLWAWCGGLLGASFVLGNIFLVPKLGISISTIAILLGQISCGVVIDHFGLFSAPINTVNLQKLMGISLLIISIYVLNIQ